MNVTKKISTQPRFCPIGSHENITFITMKKISKKFPQSHPEKNKRDQQPLQKAAEREKLRRE